MSGRRGGGKAMKVTMALRSRSSSEASARISVMGRGGGIS